MLSEQWDQCRILLSDNVYTIIKTITPPKIINIFWPLENMKLPSRVAFKLKQLCKAHFSFVFQIEIYFTNDNSVEVGSNKVIMEKIRVV